jgi:Relaxase/Mobilisation nuclease domain
MIAKIMKSAQSFDAVYYNDNKIKEQKATFLTAANFHTSGTNLNFLSRNDAITYFNKVSDLNPRVKNKQFHAVISTKGTEHTAEELKSIAEEYIKKMGYGDNPYLLYFHQDTDNNHVHIVSTRVDKNGEKVDDSFEKKRSLETIKAIMSQSNRREWTAQNVVDDVFQYSFSTEGQLKTLLELKGYSMQRGDNGGHEIWKDNLYVASIEAERLQEKLKNPKDEARAKQIKGIVLKYKEGRGEEELQAFLKEKFGIEMVFHRNEKAETPYGYTIIDHANKRVFKGSEVLKMAEILKNREGVFRNNQEGDSHVKQVDDLLNKNDKAALMDYMDKHDLLFMQSDSQFYLIDRQNDEIFDMTHSRSKVNPNLIIDLDLVEKANISRSMSLGAGGADESESDRKRKKGYKR